MLRAQQGQELDDVLTTCWGRAMLDTNPDRNRIHAAATDGTLPTTTIGEVRHRRQDRSARERRRINRADHEVILARIVIF